MNPDPRLRRRIGGAPVAVLDLLRRERAANERRPHRPDAQEVGQGRRAAGDVVNGDRAELVRSGEPVNEHRGDAPRERMVSSR